MSNPKTNYGTARFVLGVVQFIGWAVIILSGIVLIIALADNTIAQPIYVIVISVIIGANGLVIIAVAQLGLATIGTAESTQDILSLMRESLEHTNALGNSDSRIEPRFLSSENEAIKVYKGYEIAKTEHGYSVNNKQFTGVLMAYTYVDGLKRNESGKP